MKQSRKLSIRRDSARVGRKRPLVTAFFIACPQLSGFNETAELVRIDRKSTCFVRSEFVDLFQVEGLQLAYFAV